jgi:hypothetical protein
LLTILSLGLLFVNSLLFVDLEVFAWFILRDIGNHCTFWHNAVFGASLLLVEVGALTAWKKFAD